MKERQSKPTTYRWVPPALRGSCVYFPDGLALGDIYWYDEPPVTESGIHREATP
jgi:hypothetical protein